MSIFLLKKYSSLHSVVSQGRRKVVIFRRTGSNPKLLKGERFALGLYWTSRPIQTSGRFWKSGLSENQPDVFLTRVDTFISRKEKIQIFFFLILCRSIFHTKFVSRKLIVRELISPASSARQVKCLKNISPDSVRSGTAYLANSGVRSCPVRKLICQVQSSPILLLLLPKYGGEWLPSLSIPFPFSDGTKLVVGNLMKTPFCTSCTMYRAQNADTAVQPYLSATWAVAEHIVRKSKNWFIKLLFKDSLLRNTSFILSSIPTKKKPIKLRIRSLWTMILHRNWRIWQSPYYIPFF